MLEKYKTIYKGNSGEIIEKKSRFIATVRLTQTEEEALDFIAEMKKKYWNATHNCFAYVIGERGENMRCSDDGEPSGTAGKPMLDVLLGEGLRNTTVVVTRYFGGTLLGTGGLVRAYSKAVGAGLDASTIIEKQPGVLLEIVIDYNGSGKIQYLVNERKLPILDTEYTDKVRFLVMVPSEQLKELQTAVTEATSARAVMQTGEEEYYGMVNGKVLRGEELRG